MVELLVGSGAGIYVPCEEGITWSTERKGSPGQLQFKVVAGSSTFTEGDAVRMRVDGQNVFYGFVFKQKRERDNIVTVTAYDQLRYLKNKDTYVYENKTASQLIQMIAGDFRLNLGTIESTGFNIESRIEENTSLFDMIQNALDLTLQNTKALYVLYDDAGRLTLRSLGNMRINALISAETAENFDYESSIDGNTYNKIKLTYDNEKSGTREVYIAQDGANMNQWGVLQYFDTLKDDENGAAKANALLSLYNTKTRTLSIKNAFGDIRVRAGSLIPVMLNLGDISIQNYMLVEKCKHEFKESQHLMTLTLRGGEFVA